MRILYATDGSDGALAAARLLRCLELAPDSEILLLAVGGPGEEEEEEARRRLRSPRNSRQISSS